jgi:hypothetical protein
MKRAAFLILLSFGAIAETGSARFPTCGGPAPTVPHCSCAIRVQAIQERAVRLCMEWGATPETCLVEEPTYCEVVDGGFGTGDGPEPFYMKTLPEEKARMGMEHWCGKVCEHSRDCKCCHNHELCHVGHRPEDHRK